MRLRTLHALQQYKEQPEVPEEVFYLLLEEEPEVRHIFPLYIITNTATLDTLVREGDERTRTLLLKERTAALTPQHIRQLYKELPLTTDNLILIAGHPNTPADVLGGIPAALAGQTSHDTGRILDLLPQHLNASTETLLDVVRMVGTPQYWPAAEPLFSVVRHQRVTAEMLDMIARIPEPPHDREWHRSLMISVVNHPLTATATLNYVESAAEHSIRNRSFSSSAYFFLRRAISERRAAAQHKRDTP